MSKKILFINNRITASGVPGVLSRAGYNLDVVFSPDEVLRKPDTPEYDLIILLVNPDVESWIACAWIRHSTLTPLIVISPEASVETCVKGINAGADYFIRKTYGPMELIARINSLINRSAVRQPISTVSQ